MRILLSTLIAFLLCANAAAAGFQCPDIPENEEEAIKKAGHHFSKGDKFAKVAKYKKALERYLCSLSMKSHFNTLQNIVNAVNLLDDKEESVAQLGDFLDRNSDAELFDEISTFIVKLELDEAIESAEELAPVEVVEPEPEPQPVQVVPVVDTEVVERKEVVDENARGPRAYRAVGITLLGLSAATIGGSIALTIASLDARDEALYADNWAYFQENEEKYGTLSTLAAVGFGLSAAMIVAGSIFIYRYKNPGSKSDREKKSAHIQLSPGPLSFSLTGTF